MYPQRITKATSKQVKIENSVLFSLIRNLNLQKKGDRRVNPPGHLQYPPEPNRSQPEPQPGEQHKDLQRNLGLPTCPPNRKHWVLRPGMRTHFPIPGLVTPGDPNLFSISPKLNTNNILVCRDPDQHVHKLHLRRSFCCECAPGSGSFKK